MDSQVVLVVKNPLANAGDIRDAGSIPGFGGSPGGQHGYPLQYSGLENHMVRGPWWATVQRVAESDLTEWLSMHTCTHTFHRWNSDPLKGESYTVHDLAKSPTQWLISDLSLSDWAHSVHIHIAYDDICFHATLLRSSHLLSPPHCVQKSFLYVWISIASLKEKDTYHILTHNI